MGTISSNVVFKLGLFTLTANVQSAKQAAASNVMVAVIDGALARVQQSLTCNGTPVDRTEVRRAREVDGGLVLLEDADLAALNEHAAQFKKDATITPHPADSVDTETVPGEKLYYLTPAAGHADTYATLKQVVLRHPELAFMTRWTARSSVAVYRFGVRNDRLIIQERVAADALREAPLVPEPNTLLLESLIPMAEKVLELPGVVQRFDLATYRDQTSETLEALLKGREVLADPGTTRKPGAAVPTHVLDPMKALEQMLATKQRRPRKPRAKVPA